MSDDASPESQVDRSRPSTALIEYLAQSDRLIAFQLFVSHGALALAKALATATANSAEQDDVIAEFSKILGRPQNVRLPHPDEVIYHFHFSLFAQMLTARHVDNFLTYLVQLLTEVFLARPDALKSQEQVRVDFVLAQPDRESLVRALAERRVDRLAYLGMRDLDKELQDRLGLSLFAGPDDLETAVALIEMRNVVIHNRGIVNAVAGTKAPSLSTRIGQPVPVGLDDLSRQRSFFARLVRDIDRRAVQKFQLGGRTTAAGHDDAV